MNQQPLPDAIAKQELDLLQAQEHLTGKTEFSGQPRAAVAFGTTPYSAHEAHEIEAQLAIPLSKKDVKTRPGPGGKSLTYVEGWRAIDIANSIFGFDGWSSQLVSLDVRSCRQTENQRWNACVMATMRVTLRNGAFHEDRGGGIAENKKTREEAQMAAEKEAITDACKRALKNFGRRLGLSLYSDEHLRSLSAKQPVVQQPVRTCPNQIQSHMMGEAPSARNHTSVAAPQASRNLQNPQQNRAHVNSDSLQHIHNRAVRSSGHSRRQMNQDPGNSAQDMFKLNHENLTPRMHGQPPPQSVPTVTEQQTLPRPLTPSEQTQQRGLTNPSALRPPLQRSNNQLPQVRSHSSVANGAQNELPTRLQQPSSPNRPSATNDIHAKQDKTDQLSVSTPNVGLFPVQAQRLQNTTSNTVTEKSDTSKLLLNDRDTVLKRNEFCSPDDDSRRMRASRTGSNPLFENQLPTNPTSNGSASVSDDQMLKGNFDVSTPHANGFHCRTPVDQYVSPITPQARTAITPINTHSARPGSGHIRGTAPAPGKSVCHSEHAQGSLKRPVSSADSSSAGKQDMPCGQPLAASVASGEISNSLITSPNEPRIKIARVDSSSSTFENKSRHPLTSDTSSSLAVSKQAHREPGSTGQGCAEKSSGLARPGTTPVNGISNRASNSGLQSALGTEKRYEQLDIVQRTKTEVDELCAIWASDMT